MPFSPLDPADADPNAPGSYQVAPAAPAPVVPAAQGSFSPLDPADADPNAPGSYTAEPETVHVTADAPDTIGGDAADLAENIGTGLARVPGAIIGTPHVLAHTLNWLRAHIIDTATDRNPGDANYLEGADVDKYDPLARLTPTSDTIDKGVFGGLSAVKQGLVGGDPVTPYEPKTFIGKLLQAGVTGAGAGLLDPAAIFGAARAASPIASMAEGAIPRMMTTAAAAGGASAANQIYPGSPLAPVLAAVIAHITASAGVRGASAGIPAVKTLANTFTKPQDAGEDAAGYATTASPSPGVANPSAADVSAQQSAVGGQTAAIPMGENPLNAFAGMKAYLSSLKGNLQGARSDVVKPYGDALRAEQPTTPEQLAPLLSQLDPSTLQTAMNSAASNMKNTRGAGAPYSSYTDFNRAGDPIYRPTGVNGDDIPAASAELLDRTRTKLGNNATEAQANNKGAPEVAALRGAAQTVSDFMDNRYPNTAPQMRAAYANASKPLQAFDHPDVSAAISQNKDQLGNPIGYTQNNAELFSQLAKAKDPASVIQPFIDAAGHDTPVTDTISDAIVGHLREEGAIDATTGELNTKVYEAKVQPFLKTLSMYAPKVLDQFGTAKAAQATLDNMRAQKVVSDGVAGYGMRTTGDANGVVTRASAQNWLSRNQSALDATQPGTSMNAKAFIDNLPTNPLRGPEDLEDAAPIALGKAFGMSDVVPLQLLGHIWNNTLGGRVKNFGDYYSKAIERAMVDPQYKTYLANKVAGRPSGMSNVLALKSGLLSDFDRMARTLPAAVNAGQSPSPSP